MTNWNGVAQAALGDKIADLQAQIENLSVELERQRLVIEQQGRAQQATAEMPMVAPVSAPPANARIGD